VAHRVATRAESDLDDIWLYVAMESGSLEVASRLVEGPDVFILRVVHGRRDFEALFER